MSWSCNLQQTLSECAEYLQQYSKHVLNTWWIISIGYMNTDFRMELKNASDIISEVSSIFSCYPSVILCWILLDVRFCIVSINSGGGAVCAFYILSEYWIKKEIPSFHSSKFLYVLFNALFHYYQCLLSFLLLMYLLVCGSAGRRLNNDKR